MPAVYFKPKGDHAEWEMVYALLADTAVGDVITYEALSAALGRDFLLDRAPVYKAMGALEETNKRTLVNVQKLGYRVATAAEHEPLARGHHKRSRRQLRKAINKIASADRSQLSAADRERFDSMELTLGRQSDMLRRLGDRVTRVEKVTAQVQKEHKATAGEMSDRLAKLEEMLRSHGIAS